MTLAWIHYYVQLAGFIGQWWIFACVIGTMIREGWIWE